MAKETFYDILGVSSNATREEIKKSYKLLALKHHPDKNLDNIDECTKRFTFIQEAYTILSNPKERDWYDRHKEAFHADSEHVVDFSIDEIYFSCECFDRFDDSANGFYTVYRTLFDEIVQQELQFKEPNSDRVYPTFGNSHTDLDQVKLFYDVWQSFSTALTFAHLDKHDIREAPNRRIVRLMQKENNKLREEAKKDRNMNIKNLVTFVRKKDKRMDMYRARLQAKVDENRQKSEQHRRTVIEQRNKAFANYVPPEWSSFEGLENELKDIEAHCKKNSVPKKNKNGTKVATKQNLDNDQINLEEDQEEEELYFCAACNKKFKTINSFRNHEMSKKHLACLKLYREQLSETDKDLDE